MRKMLKKVLQGEQEGWISLSLPLRLSSRGAFTARLDTLFRHSRLGSMAASQLHCCCHTLQGCFPACPACSFSPSSPCLSFPQCFSKTFFSGSQRLQWDLGCTSCPSRAVEQGKERVGRVTRSQPSAPQAPLQLWPCPSTSGSHIRTQPPCSVQFSKAERNPATPWKFF